MGRASINYINKDYESIRKELIARVPQLTERWTDFNPSDLGVVLLELFCGIGDMLAYYLDAQATEAFLPTARQRQSVIDLCKLIGYRLDTPVSSSTNLRFTVPAPIDDDVTIPAGTSCRALLSDGTADFETIEDAIIPRGEAAVSVSARQGVRKTQELSADGKVYQRFQLSGKSIAQGSISVNIDDIEWSVVDHFQDSGSEDSHFIIDTDALDVSTIIFGDGQSGKVPLTGLSITVSWLETIGDKGNLAPNIITELMTPVYLNSVQIKMTVTNPVPATGGASRESLEHARKQAPAELRSLWKAVTIEDYKALAEGYPGIAKAQVLDTNDCLNIRYYNVHLAIAPNGGGMPTQLLKIDLLEYLERRKVITVEVNLFDPLYKSINIDTEIYAWPGETLESVRIRIEDKLADYFAFDNVSFGQTIHVSDLIALIDGVRGVSHIHMFTPQNDIELRRGEIPVLGSVNLDLRRAE